MKRGVIVLALYPFTDLSDVKTRPALVVSRSDRNDSEAIVAFIGTHRGQSLETTDLLIETRHADFTATGLKQTSFVRLGKLVTLDYSILRGEIGAFSNDLMVEADQRLRHALEL